MTFFGLEVSRTVRIPAMRLVETRVDHVFCPGEDGANVPFRPKGEIFTDRAHRDRHYHVYTDHHVWLCSMPGFRPGLEHVNYRISRMGVKLRPSDGRVLDLQLNRQRLALLLATQEIEAAMLRSTRFFRD
jgi:hypothetical protein